MSEAGEDEVQVAPATPSWHRIQRIEVGLPFPGEKEYPCTWSVSAHPSWGDGMRRVTFVCYLESCEDDTFARCLLIAISNRSGDDFADRADIRQFVMSCARDSLGQCYSTARRAVAAQAAALDLEWHVPIEAPASMEIKIDYPDEGESLTDDEAETDAPEGSD